MTHPCLLKKNWREEAMKEMDKKIWHVLEDDLLIMRKIKRGITIWAGAENALFEVGRFRED